MKTIKFTLHLTKVYFISLSLGLTGPTSIAFAQGGGTIISQEEIAADLQKIKEDKQSADEQLQLAKDQADAFKELQSETNQLNKPNFPAIEKPDLSTEITGPEKIDIPLDIPMAELPLPEPPNMRRRGVNTCRLNNWEKQAGYDCGECENELQNGLNDIIDGITEADLSQVDRFHWGDILDSDKVDPEKLTMKPDANFEDTLDNILNLMREQNTAGGGALNWVMIGESESLHETTVKDGKMNPRIAVKSPNSELIVTFNTDPEAAGFNSIEIMRWNGREGRYEFQELSFPLPEGSEGVRQVASENPHGSSHAYGEPGNVDVTGNKCKQCHKSPSMRPNWDTYRAWSGVVPSRDDMLERLGDNDPDRRARRNAERAQQRLEKANSSLQAAALAESEALAQQQQIQLQLDSLRTGENTLEDEQNSEIQALQAQAYQAQQAVEDAKSARELAGQSAVKARTENDTAQAAAVGAGDATVQPDARMYYNFLDQVADAQSKNPNELSAAERRLSMLEIPFDDKRQLGGVIEAYMQEKFPGTSMTRDEFMATLSPQERVELIKRQVEEEGFYRIRHKPDIEEMREAGSGAFSMDGKTARYSGPSQFMFDQMLSQNMCRVANDLIENPNYEKIKYALHGYFNCGAQSPTRFLDYLPEEFREQARQYYRATEGASLRDSSPEARQQAANAENVDEIYDLLIADTGANHGTANDFKFDRHERLQFEYLVNVEGMNPDRARERARFHAQEVVTPTQFGFHAIGDEGGVKGVPEDSTRKVSTLRLMMEPLGINIEHWSLANGRDTAYHSFSFSDQFELLLSDQKHMFNLTDENGERLDCNEAKRLSNLALKPEEEEEQEETEQIIDPIASLCLTARVQEAVPGVRQVASELNDISIAPLEEEAKVMLQTCNGCHGADGFLEFDGLSDYLNGATEEDRNKGKAEFADFIASGKSGLYRDEENNPMEYRSLYNEKLGLHGLSHGSAMPPSDFDDNARFAEQYGIYPAASVQAYRRRMLGIYLQGLATQSDTSRNDTIRRLCGSITGTRSAGERPSQDIPSLDTPRTIDAE